MVTGFTGHSPLASLPSLPHVHSLQPKWTIYIKWCLRVGFWGNRNQQPRHIYKTKLKIMFQAFPSLHFFSFLLNSRDQNGEWINIQGGAWVNCTLSSDCLPCREDSLTHQYIKTLCSCLMHPGSVSYTLILQHITHSYYSMLCVSGSPQKSRGLWFTRQMQYYASDSEEKWQIKNFQLIKQDVLHVHKG